MNRKILVIYTGGTIGMMKNPESGALEAFKFEDIYTHLPMLKLIEADVEFVEMLPLIDSADTNPFFWIRLATMIKEYYDYYDGFVILHGTDTMSYTASALSFLLENLAKPVILTGSQLPLGVMRTDGRENILNSIEIAADYKNGKPCVPEVCIYFENALYRGNRTYKDNAEFFNAFTSSNYPKLAEIGVAIKYNTPYIHVFPEEPIPDLILRTKMDDNVAILKLYPGITEKAIARILSVPDLRAVIMETYGSGNAPSNQRFISLLKSAIDKGIIIVSVTQCKGGGAVEIGKYATSLELGKIGVISAYDMTLEAALTKLMYLLGQGLDNEEVNRWMQISLRGEITNPIR